MENMNRMLLPVLAAAALAGCYTRGDMGVGYSYGYASGGYASPDLYYMSPGVSVVAYADNPTFYSDNYYWMYSGNQWYRSNNYGGGWVVYNDVPYGVRSINRPYSYTRFQPGRGWNRVSGNAGYRNNTRYNANTRAPTPAYAPPRGGRGYTPPARSTYRAPAARSGGSYTPPPARANGGVTTTPRGGGPTVRDHRRR
jgi:hypothetical protein